MGRRGEGVLESCLERCLEAEKGNEVFLYAEYRLGDGEYDGEALNFLRF